MSLDQLRSIIAMVETGNNPDAKMGDDGCAIGLYQAHIDWVWTWAHHYDMSPMVDEKFNSFVGRVLIVFLTDHINNQHFSPLSAIMYYHMGNPHDWDKDYADKLMAAGEHLGCPFSV